MTLGLSTIQDDPHDRLLDELDGFWREGNWAIAKIPVPGLPENNGITKRDQLGRVLWFEKLFPTERLRVEVQYACKHLMLDGNWSPKGMLTRGPHLGHFSKILKELPRQVVSLLDLSWEEWEEAALAWYRGNNPKAFKTSKFMKRDPSGGYKEERCTQKPNGVGTIKGIYEAIEDFFCDTDEWARDVVDLAKLPGAAKKKLNFGRVPLLWLKQPLREYVRLGLANDTFGPEHASSLISAVVHFSKYIEAHQPLVTSPKKVSRKVAVCFADYVNGLKTKRPTSKQGPGEPLKPGSKANILNHVRTFIRDSGRMGIAPFSKENLFHEDDYPSGPKDDDVSYIPESIVEQMLDHLDYLLQPWRGMLGICLDIGIRGGDCTRFPLNSLFYDDDGDPYVQFVSSKVNREEQPKPITERTLHLIQDAQVRAVALAGESCGVLFPKNKAGETYKRDTFVAQVRIWIVSCDIRDEDGKHWYFTSHQCRHTVGVRIINNGGSLSDAMYMLGHLDPSTAIKYDRVLAETRKAEWAKYKGVAVDYTGKPVDDLDDENSVEKQWLKHNLRKQALPNGYCKKEGGCPHANRCLSIGCKAFRTCKGFLDVHESQLRRCEELAAEAEKEGRVQDANRNNHIARKLRTLMDHLKEQDDGELINAED